MNTKCINIRDEEIYGDETVNETVEMFNGLVADEGNVGVMGVKRDIGIFDDEQDEGASDLLGLDPSLTAEEFDIADTELSEEGTEIIREFFFKSVCADAFKEITEFSKDLPERKVAYESYMTNKRNFDFLVDVQEKMQSLMPRIQVLTVARDEARVSLDSWVKRYNNWKASEAFKTYRFKSKAADIFFKGLKEKKANYQDLKATVQGAWDTWNTFKAQSDEVTKDAKFLWAWYFQLAQEEISNYFTSGDTEEVDTVKVRTFTGNVSYKVLDRASYDTETKESTYIFKEMSREETVINTEDAMEDMVNAHDAEMREYDRPESKGRGFWSNASEYKVQLSNEKKANADLDMDSLMAMMEEVA